VPLIMSLLPPLTAMQQLPLWNVATGETPFLLLYAWMNCALKRVRSAALASVQPPVSVVASKSYSPNSTSATAADAQLAVAASAHANSHELATREVGETGIAEPK
jgi:hypothetical protein